MLQTVRPLPSCFGICLAAIVAAVMLADVSAAAGVSKILKKSEIQAAPGVKYVRYVTRGRRPITIHAVYYSLQTPGIATRIIKAGNTTTARERIAEMAMRYERETHGAVLALVNANFWTAGRTTPIGPCVVDGEVVEMLPYKNWSSMFISGGGVPEIDTFRLHGWVEVGGSRYGIESANRRLSDSGVVLYNRYTGATVPSVSASRVQELYAEWLRDSMYLVSDSTESYIDTASVRLAIEKAQIESNAEHSLVKVSLRYLRSPQINKPLPCVVVGTDTGMVAVPDHGCLVSLPRFMQPPNVGDSVLIHFETNVHSDVQFMNAVCGTPRLVRNGKARHEAAQEGVTGRRFINRKLARTCVGIDKSGKTLILASIEATDPAIRQSGATLSETAQIMRLLGAYQAMNLDGGGSAGMVVNHDHVFFEGVDPLTRPISVGLAIVRLSQVPTPEVRQWR